MQLSVTQPRIGSDKLFLHKNRTFWVCAVVCDFHVTESQEKSVVRLFYFFSAEGVGERGDASKTSFARRCSEGSG